jgi:hypothetical protein
MSAMKLIDFAVAVAATALLASQTPAVAATVSFDDKTGDAKAKFDITHVTFGNGEKSVSVRAEIRDLLLTGVQAFGMSVTLQGVDGSYAAHTIRHADGGLSNELWQFDGDGSHRIDCDVRARWRPGKDVVRLRFPQSCLPVQRRMSSAAYMIRGADTDVQPADWTRTLPVPFD